MFYLAGLLCSVPAEAKGALAILTGNRDLWSDALALWVQVGHISCGRRPDIYTNNLLNNL